MIRICGFLATLAHVGLGLTAASAATITPPPVSTLEIIGVTGEWIDTTGGIDVRGTNTGSVHWGIPARERVAQSGYSFDGVDDGTPQLPETDFLLGTFTHNNRVINLGTSVKAARLQVSFDVRIRDLTNGLFRLVSAVSTFDFQHWETVNDEPVCANGMVNREDLNVNGCADRVILAVNPSFSDSFEMGGAFYRLDISGFDRADPFWTIEDRANRSDLIGRFTAIAAPDPSPVPLPATGWLLLAAVAGVGVARRRSPSRA